MSTRQTDTCLAKVDANEPIFVLRAQDGLAPQVVRLWANLLDGHVKACGDFCHPVEVRLGMRAKVEEARTLAGAMERWPTRKLPD